MRLIASIISVILVLALAGTAWLFYSEHEKSREQVEQISKLKTQLTDKSTQQLFDLQRKCAAEAEQFFKQWNASPLSSKRSEFADQQSHYNASRNTCFVLIRYMDMATGLSMQSLFDAVERRQYAEFSQQLGLQTMICTLMPLNSVAKPCKSEDELNAFVATYMQ